MTELHEIHALWRKIGWHFSAYMYPTFSGWVFHCILPPETCHQNFSLGLSVLWQPKNGLLYTMTCKKLVLLDNRASSGTLR